MPLPILPLASYGSGVVAPTDAWVGTAAVQVEWPSAAFAALAEWDGAAAVQIEWPTAQAGEVRG